MTAVADAPALRAARKFFTDYARPWWISGGWAVDLHIGHVRRDHGDVDVLVLARDLGDFAETFAGHHLVTTDHRTGEEQRWSHPTPVEPGRQTLRFVDTPEAAGIEVLVALADDEDWVFHRGRRMRRALSEITATTPDGLDYLQPDLVLLFKARDGRAKDERDFHDLLPHLTPEQKTWLRPRLAPPGAAEHPWAGFLPPGR